MWFCTEDSISETPVERLRVPERRSGETRAFRPEDGQLNIKEWKGGRVRTMPYSYIS